MRPRARFSPWARARGEYAGWAALLLAMSAAVGLAAGIKPSIGVALAIGVAFSLVTLSDVTAGLVPGITCDVKSVLPAVPTVQSDDSGAWKATS